MNKRLLLILPISLLALSGCNNTSNDSEPISPEPTLKVYESVSEIRSSGVGGKAKINAKVIIKDSSSFIAYDGTGLILCYGYAQTNSVSVGNNYTIEGDVAFYNNMLQFSESSQTDEETSEKITTSTFTVTSYSGEVPDYNQEATTLSSINAYTCEEIEYVHFDQLVVYKNGNYYNASKLGSDTKVVSLKGSSTYMSILSDTSKDRPITISCTGYLTGISSDYYVNLFVSEEVQKVDVDVTSLTITDSLSLTYNLRTVYDNSNGLNVVANHENGMKVTLNKDEFTYKVKDSNSNDIDTSKAFENAGTYYVTVTHTDSGISSALFEFNVDDSDDTIVSLTPNELGTLNNWKTGNSSNKVGKMDDVISLEAGGSATGKWSQSNNTWTITQKSTTSDYPNGGYIKISALEGYYLKSITISYSPNSDDTVGHFENLESDVKKDMEENCESYLDYVKGASDEITNSCVRIRRITVMYANKNAE